MRFVKGSLFFVAAQGMSIRGSPDNKLAVVDDACPVDSPAANYLGSFKFDDQDVVDFMKHSKDTTEPTKAERKEFNSAMDQYKTSQAKMQKASQRMMHAMEAMLEVPSMEKDTLTAMLEKKDKDTFIVFYAPWCPHCQSFVLHDGKGNPEKAPLEVFSKDMKARGASKTLNVVRWDVDSHRDVPKDFKVQYIPTMYLAAADGTMTQYKGNPGDTEALVKFIEEKSSKTKKIEALSLR